MKHRTVMPIAVASLWVVMTCMSASASATTITSSEGTTPFIEFAAEGHVVLDNPIAKIECPSEMAVGIQSHGTGVTAKGTLFWFQYEDCTNSWMDSTTIASGSLEFHATGSGRATVTSSGLTWESTRFGVTCRYATNNTDIGTLTPGTPATLDISASIPFHGGSFLCGSGATTWTGSYTVTSPATVSVDS